MTPVDPVDKPNEEQSIAGEMIVPELQVGVTQDSKDYTGGDVL